MIINDKEASARLASPMNLINRLRSSNGNGNKKNNAMSLFGIGRKTVEISTEEKLIEEVKVTFNPFSAMQKREESQTSSLPQLVHPLTQPAESLDNILENHDSQIKLSLAHDKALDLLHRSVDALALKLDDVRADRLPSVISAASKTVESIRKERLEASKSGKDKEVHFHFYTPQQRQLSDYEVIDVA